MSLDIQTGLSSHAHGDDAHSEANARGESMENLLLVLFSALSAVVVSVIWVAFSLG